MKFSRVGLLVFLVPLFFAVRAELSVDASRTAFAQSSRSERIPGAERAGGAETRAERTQVTGLKLLTLKDQTRVMLDLSRETKFEVRRLKEDPANHTPARIYIDIVGAKLALASKDTLRVDDGVLRQVRVGQYSADVVRVVIDMDSLRAHNAFIIPEPTQLVIDILALGAPQKLPAKEVATRAEPVSQKSIALAKKADLPAAAAGLRKIVLDPGHGGRDPGAIGAGGVAEKDIVFSVAKRLARKLRGELGVQVILTRHDDRFVPLEDRAALANSEGADLFISLHVNASPNSEARGIETYYLDNTTDEAAIRLAARENDTSRRNISDLQFILSDMTQNVKLEDSITLAHRLQGALVGGMSQGHG